MWRLVYITNNELITINSLISILKEDKRKEEIKTLSYLMAKYKKSKR